MAPLALLLRCHVSKAFLFIPTGRCVGGKLEIVSMVTRLLGGVMIVERRVRAGLVHFETGSRSIRCTWGNFGSQERRIF